MSSTLILLSAIGYLHAAFPNDEYYPSKQKRYFEAIRVPDAWKYVEGMPRKYKTIAIIDSGMQSSHLDLRANAVRGYNVIDKNNDTHDRLGHGTAVAGVAGAVINNRVGVAGITDYVKLMPIYDGPEELDEDIAASIDHAVYAKADVILLAAGREAVPFTDDVIAAIERASKADIPLVCPSGNDGWDITKPGKELYPCMYAKTMPGVICVAATSEDSMNLHPLSSYAFFVDVAAPGDVYTTMIYDEYGSASGTSGAAAIVAGVVALMKSVSPKHLTVQEIKSIIKQTSTPGVVKNKLPMLFGRLNALSAVRRVIR
ncbi:hypothetical protein FOL47_009147 [Perkinsus chesapeaki]|uniref:subtilisin n=1 Tax=Perkinsus chesapeaki TaxID=330153 RepID=A0A7J6MSG1_PERCH|nr:hypothetical protein FOL47_009147 [Perkinsus chesapeaki]